MAMSSLLCAQGDISTLRRHLRKGPGTVRTQHLAIHQFIPVIQCRMCDTEKMEAPPALSSSSQPLWPRIAGQFTADRVTAGFTVILALATLALVFTAYFQHRDAVEAIQATQRLAIATENSVTNRRQTSSATLLLKLDDTLEGSRYQKIITEIRIPRGQLSHSYSHTRKIRKIHGRGR